MRVEVVHNVLKLNDTVAAGIRRELAARGITALNLLSSPGSGKTTLLERTLAHFAPIFRQAVVVGDLATARDAERLADHAQAVQINTDGGCHLDAAMVSRALERLDLTGVDLLWIENVGNLVCPVGFDLGEAVKVGLLSVAEGDDKVAKYPRLWREAGAVVLNKIDLLPYVSFDRAGFERDLRAISATVPVFEVSATSGLGLAAWYEWVESLRAAAADGG